MKNTIVLATKRDFNDFTLALKARCEAEGEVMVGLRDGTFVKVLFRPASEKDFTEDAFHSLNHGSYWEPSGHSVTSSRFDIVEFEGGPAGAPVSEAEQRFKQACWLSLEFAIHRYLMSNAKGRWDSAEKAHRHIELSTFYVAVVRGVSRDDVRMDFEADFKAVHDQTQALTDNLDEAIGFPLETDPDYDALAPNFFERFHALALAALETK
jgi:hypothetical protein